MRPIAILLVVLFLTTAGCQRAGRYSAPPSPTEIQGPKAPEPVDPLLAWLPDTHNKANPGARLVFVAEETDADAWRNFTDAAMVQQPQTFLRRWASLKIPSVVHVKVPRGLPDPTPLLPDANPPTLGKFTLGRQLFHDPDWLTADGKISCATCHKPDRAFTDSLVHDGLRTPTLVNVAYNTTQFHDGRVVYLEEVVQHNLDDEGLPEHPPRFRHAWGGVVTRLNINDRWRGEFDKVFGTRPTQDAVGKAMATYLRTLLAGDSMQDRADAARRARGSFNLSADDYQASLDNAFLTSLGEKADARTSISRRLEHGNELFQTWCVRCHSGPGYTDHGFHNIGVSPFPDLETGTGLGRFGALPLGLKQRDALYAYATPTLRGLPRSGPYFHNGEMKTLEDVVRFHAHGGQPNAYLDAGYEAQQKRLGYKAEALSKEEQNDVVLFLRALEGTGVHPQVAGPPA